MKDFSKHVYKSTKWKKVRKLVIIRSGGLCEQKGCESPGYIVHHIIELTPENVNNDSTYDMNNLKYVCKKCHDRIHDFATKKITMSGLRFDDMGNIVEEGWKE